MQEGCAPQRTAVVDGRRPLRGVGNQVNFAVFDGIDDVRPAFGVLVDLDGLNPLLGEETLGSGRGQETEAEARKQPRRFEDARLVDILYRHEHRQAGS